MRTHGLILLAILAGACGAPAPTRESLRGEDEPLATGLEMAARGASGHGCKARGNRYACAMRKGAHRYAVPAGMSLELTNETGGDLQVNRVKAFMAATHLWSEYCVAASESVTIGGQPAQRAPGVGEAGCIHKLANQ